MRGLKIVFSAQTLSALSSFKSDLKVKLPCKQPLSVVNTLHASVKITDCLIINVHFDSGNQEYKTGCSFLKLYLPLAFWKRGFPCKQTELVLLPHWVSWEVVAQICAHIGRLADCTLHELWITPHSPAGLHVYITFVFREQDWRWQLLVSALYLLPSYDTYPLGGGEYYFPHLVSGVVISVNVNIWTWNIDMHLLMLHSCKGRSIYHLNKGQLYKGNSNSYWSISRATKAMTKGIQAIAPIAPRKYQSSEPLVVIEATVPSTIRRKTTDIR